jgi:hypothetical protein
MRTDKYIVIQAKPGEGDIPFVAQENLPAKDVMERVIDLDSGVIKGAFYVDTAWFWKATPPGPQTHAHPFPEVLGFFGTNPKDPHDLCGEVELWIDGEKHLLHESFLAFIPKDMKHCPLRITRVDRPIFHFSTGPQTMYGGEEK